MNDLLRSLPVEPIANPSLPGSWRPLRGQWALDHEAKAPTAFTQLVPSIQVRLRRGETLRILMAAETADGWTRWFDVGWMGDHTGLPARRVLRGPDGAVGIDVLVLKKPARRWRLRLALASEREPWRLPWGMTTVTWRSAGKHRLWNAVPTMKRGVKLTVPCASQMAEGGKHSKVSCSSFTVKMMLGYHGNSPSTRRVLNASWDPVAEIFGNWQSAMKAAWDFDQPGTLVFFRHWGQVLDCLKAGIPVGASIRYPSGKLSLPGARVEHSNGHLLVIHGMTPGGKILTNDPAADSRAEVPTDYPLVPFSRAWFGNSGMGYLLFGTD